MACMQVETVVIADTVRGIAHQHHLTQLDVAELLGLERKAVSARYQGRVPFTAAEIKKLSGSLGIPAGAFFGEVPAVRGVA
jgi:transcriptional regulator with XRE-family HTH domain